MLDTKQMRTSSHLLPDPGGEVVRELLDEVERLRLAARKVFKWREKFDWVKDPHRSAAWPFFDEALRELDKVAGREQDDNEKEDREPTEDVCS